MIHRDAVGERRGGRTGDRARKGGGEEGRTNVEPMSLPERLYHLNFVKSLFSILHSRRTVV